MIVDYSPGLYSILFSQTGQKLIMIIFTWHKNSTRMSLVACHTSSAITLVKTGTGSRKEALTSLSDANTTSFVELTYLIAGVALTQRDTYSVLNMFVGDWKQ